MDSGIACQVHDRTIFERGGECCRFHILPGKQVTVGIFFCSIKMNNQEKGYDCSYLQT